MEQALANLEVFAATLLELAREDFETREAVRAAAQLPSPVYLRFGKKKVPHLPRLHTNFEMGKASLIREGTDLSFLACGEAVIPAFAAAEVRNYKRFPKMGPGLQKPGPSSNTSCVEKA